MELQRLASGTRSLFGHRQQFPRARDPARVRGEILRGKRLETKTVSGEADGGSRVHGGPPVDRRIADEQRLGGLRRSPEVCEQRVGGIRDIAARIDERAVEVEHDQAEHVHEAYSAYDVGVSHTLTRTTLNPCSHA